MRHPMWANRKEAYANPGLMKEAFFQDAGASKGLLIGQTVYIVVQLNALEYFNEKK